MSNIAEGFSRYHKKEFIRFLDIAQSSAAEVKSLIYVVLDQEYASLESVKMVQKLTDDCRYLTLGLLKYCRKNANYKSDVVKETAAEYIAVEDVDLLDLPDNFINRNEQIA